LDDADEAAEESSASSSLGGRRENSENWLANVVAVVPR